MTTVITDEENEILESIYPDEYQRLDGNRAIITQDVSIDLDEFLGLNYKTTLEVICHADYPQTIPEIKISIDPIHDPQTVKFNLESKDIDEIESQIKNDAAMNVGEPMIFSLVSALPEIVNNVQKKRYESHQKEQQLLRNMEAIKENAKFHGTPVTPQSFEAWRVEFEKETLKAKDIENSVANLSLKKSSAEVQPRKLTGREMFEQDKSLMSSDLIIDESQIIGKEGEDDESEEFIASEPQ